MTKLASTDVTAVSCRKRGKGSTRQLTPQQSYARRVSDHCWELASQAFHAGDRASAVGYLDIAKDLWHNTCIHTERSAA
jgi:hypothetical protein